jgi:hypothetical protein
MQPIWASTVTWCGGPRKSRLLRICAQGTPGAACRVTATSHVKPRSVLPADQCQQGHGASASLGILASKLARRDLAELLTRPGPVIDRASTAQLASVLQQADLISDCEVMCFLCLPWCKPRKVQPGGSKADETTHVTDQETASESASVHATSDHGTAQEQQPLQVPEQVHQEIQGEAQQGQEPVQEQTQTENAPRHSSLSIPPERRWLINFVASMNSKPCMGPAAVHTMTKVRFTVLHWRASLPCLTCLSSDLTTCVRACSPCA